MAYDAPLEELSTFWNGYFKPFLFIEHGHSFEELDRLSIEQIGYLLGYLSESGRAKEALRKRARK